MDEHRHSTPSEQPLLPFDVPSDDGGGNSGTEDAPSVVGDADAPIAFALTAAGQRAVDPGQLPALRVAPAPSSADDRADDDADDPSDTRPSRARALRRAGLPWSAIAAQLDVDELVARAWAEDVPAAAGRRRPVRRTAGAGRPSRSSNPSVHTGLTPGDRTGTGDDVADTPDRVADVAPSAAPTTSTPAVDDVEDVGAQLTRAQAAQEARQRLAEDPGFAAGVGLLSGLGASEPRAVTFGTADPRIAGRVLTWLRDYADLDDHDVRVVLRLGADVAGDLARHRWTSDLDLDRSRVAATRTGHTIERDTVHGLVRVVDPDLAATVAGWCDALLEDPDPALDVAF